MLTREPGTYIGRFAPSPTGPLHFGSLVAAVASYLQAKVNNGLWLLRVEDIDPPRAQPGATDVILNALDLYGFEWDGEVVFQSGSRTMHDAALQLLLDRKQAYSCGCSRRDLADCPSGPLGTIYPGTCRDGSNATETAIRVLTTAAPISFLDKLQGMQTQSLETQSGDFIIRRRDGLIAYQLAVVVDDQIEGVTEVVRGIDLLDSTPRQIWLQRLLGYRTPEYLHLPVVTHPNGDKLSKATGADGIPTENRSQALVASLVALQQHPPAGLENDTEANIWQWAIKNWCLDTLRGKTNVSVDSPEMTAIGREFW